MLTPYNHFINDYYRFNAKRGMYAGGSQWAGNPKSQVAKIFSYYDELFASQMNVASLFFGNLEQAKFENMCAGQRKPGGRCLNNGGLDASASARLNVIEYVDMMVPGDWTDFGDALTAIQEHGGAGNRINAFWFSGSTDLATVSDQITKSTFDTLSDSTDVANVTQERLGPTASGNDYYILLGGGKDIGGGAYYDIIDKFDMELQADMTDYGDLSATRFIPASAGGHEKVVFMGGYDSGGTPINVVEDINYLGMTSVVDVGDLSEIAGAPEASASLSYFFKYCGTSTGTTNVRSLEVQSFYTPGNMIDLGDINISLPVFWGGYASGG